MCVCVHVCHVCVRALGSQKRVLPGARVTGLELELQAVISLQMLVLGSELRFSGKEASTNAEPPLQTGVFLSASAILFSGLLQEQRSIMGMSGLKFFSPYWFQWWRQWHKISSWSHLPGGFHTIWEVHILPFSWTWSNLLCCFFPLFLQLSPILLMLSRSGSWIKPRCPWIVIRKIPRYALLRQAWNFSS